MDFAIQVGFYAVGLPLEVLAISAVLRSGFRRYPLVFAYVIAVFLTTVVEMPASLAYYWALYAGKLNRAISEAWTSSYWRDEGILQVTIFATVISLIYSASSKLAAKRTIRFVLVAGALLFVSISFLLTYDPDVKAGIWMTPWTMYLRFCSAILDLALWALLIQAKEKNRVLLMLSGGLGIMFAGGAIGEAIRNIATGLQSPALSRAGGVVVIVADLMLLYILWQVFRKEGPAEMALAYQKKSRP